MFVGLGSGVVSGVVSGVSVLAEFLDAEYLDALDLMWLGRAISLLPFIKTCNLGTKIKKKGRAVRHKRHQ